MIQRIAVFCGSAPGADPAYAQAARRLGQLMGEQGRTLVFGGCANGLMREISRAVLEAGGRVESDFIRALYRPSDHLPGAVERLHDTLEERKVSLIAHSDACAVLPGGMGTLDEVSEVCVRMQLGLARRPVALLNTLGYYDGLDAFRQRMAKEGFLSPEWAQIWTKKDSPEELLSWLDAQTQ